MASTISDFWKMVWQEGGCTVAMITNAVEGHKVKCEEYYPINLDYNQKLCGPWKIFLTGIETYANFTIRSIRVEVSKGTLFLLVGT